MRQVLPHPGCLNFPRIEAGRDFGGRGPCGLWLDLIHDHVEDPVEPILDAQWLRMMALERSGGKAWLSR